MEVLSYLKNFYNNYDEDGRLRSKHGLVEFLTTMRYVERYLKQGMCILDVGAGTGRYSHALAQKGYHVDAVELIPHNIEIFKSKITEGESISVRQGDATNLSGIDDNKYDITLVFGPMYHLFTEQDKLKALSETLRVTKKDGMFFVAYCISDPSILSYGFIKGHIFELIEKKMIDLDNFKAFSKPCDLFELHRKEDIDALVSHFDVTRLHYVSTDLYTNHMRDVVDNMDDRTFELYLRYHFTICERADMFGLTHHSLDILKKN